MELILLIIQVILLPMSNAGTFRDLKVISAKVLRDNLYTDWIDNMKKIFRRNTWK